MMAPHAARPVTSFLDAAGQASADLPGFARDRDTLVAIYAAMTKTRTFDTRAIALQRTGRLGTYASSLGQEAVSIGVAGAMRTEDVFVPSFREHGAQLIRGVTLEELFLYWATKGFSRLYPGRVTVSPCSGGGACDAAERRSWRRRRGRW